ncbi:MAG: glycoside hydrolase family 130 protein [Vulcanimicrobiota bacterium]
MTIKVRRLDQKTLVRPADLKPSHPELEVVGVFNPAAIRVNNDVYLLARVAEAYHIKKDDYFSSPRYIFTENKIKIEFQEFKIKVDHNGDTRKFIEHENFMRLAFISHLRLIKLDTTGFEIGDIDQSPTFLPQSEFEEFGVEDPRLTKIGNRYFFTYVAVGRETGVCTALASTEDFKTFERHGIIFCRENKDVILFPEKINGKYIAHHRPVADHKFTGPNMMSAKSPDLIHWGDHKLLMDLRKGQWDCSRMGAGTPPIKTEKGWLAIYHGVEQTDPADPVGIYRAGAALFDLEDPTRLIARSRDPILAPEQPCELEGFVCNVVFPTGLVEDSDGKTLLVYSGGADSVITVTRLSKQEVFDSLEYL